MPGQNRANIAIEYCLSIDKCAYFSLDKLASSTDNRAIIDPFCRHMRDDLDKKNEWPKGCNAQEAIGRGDP
jgi:hypothetical protein